PARHLRGRRTARRPSRRVARRGRRPRLARPARSPPTPPGRLTMAGLITPATGATHTRISGVGAYRPRRVVPNSEIVEAIDSSDEWIQERSGIKTRHFAGEGESVIEMSEAASRGALEMAGLQPSDVDAVIVATVTHP